MKGKVGEFLPHIRERLFLRYTIVDTIAGKSATDAEEVAFKNAPKYDIVVSLGGDGTLHQVINGVAKSNANCLVGVLPFGTCNDVARTLGIPLNLDKALDCVLRLNTTKYDLMTDGTNYISYALATGYLTSVAFEAKQGTKKRVGRFAYMLAGVGSLFKLKGLPFTFTLDGNTRLTDKYVYAMLINSRYAGGFNINKNEDVSNGKFKFVAIKKTKGLGSFFIFTRMFLHGIDAIKKSKNAIVRDVKNVVIENPSNQPFVLDGEKLCFLKKEIKVKTTIEMITR